MYVYPLTRLVIRKYAVHVRSCMIAGCCNCSALYIARSLWLRLQVRVKASRHFQHQPANSREGAVRQQLFVYLDLTCNYICDRLRHGEKALSPPLASQSSKGARCPPWLQSRASSAPLRQLCREKAARVSFRSLLCVTQLLRLCWCSKNIRRAFGRRTRLFLAVKWQSEVWTWRRSLSRRPRENTDHNGWTVAELFIRSTRIFACDTNMEMRVSRARLPPVPSFGIHERLWRPHHTELMQKTKPQTSKWGEAGDADSTSQKAFELKPPHLPAAPLSPHPTPLFFSR